MLLRTERFTALALGVVALSMAPTARAQVVQTGENTALPQPVSQAEVQLSMDLGWRENVPIHQDFTGANLNPPKIYADFFPTFRNGDAVRLSGLFKWRGEQIDERSNARTAPGYFSPTCGFSGELVLRGGNCNVKLGWYNVLDPNDATPPAPSEIYPLVPDSTETDMRCMDQNGNIQPAGTGFCPFGWDNHHPYRLSQLAWVPKAHNSGDIKTNPNYKGGYVAFALIGNSNTLCTQTKYSIAAHNIKSSQHGAPWITTLIYQSTIDPEGFYIAFEDLPMSEGSWRNPGPGGGENDGDFNDFVYYVSGISCMGGGAPCTTALQGACSLGRTDCALQGETPSCRSIIQPGAELCDNVDNDCNGVVDDGEGLCEAGFACDSGVCVKGCSTGEFPCAGTLVCDDDLCVEAACLGVRCDPGQACRAGTCVDPCTNATCPQGQECQLGRCVDPCKGVTCPAGRVCERGLCVSDCNCRGCADGATCGSDGLCFDPACVGVSCSAGQVCKQGNCVDPCAGVACPGGGQCINGTCSDPTGSGGSPGAGGTGIDGDGGIPIGGTGGQGAGGDGTARRKPPPVSPGCACRVPQGEGTTSSLAWLGAALAAFAGARRIRRSARK